MRAAPAAPAWPAATAGSVASSWPSTIQILGRRLGMENADICGEYCLVGPFADRPAYQQKGSMMTIRYHPPHDRWVIDREGLRESDICVAYADDIKGMLHPTAQLMWRLYESTTRSYCQDDSVVSVDGPAKVSVVGRAGDRENVEVNGAYELVGAFHGLGCYKQVGGVFWIKYLQREHRWFISSDFDPNSATAYADAGGCRHPGHPGLCWNFWEGSKCSHIPDPAVKIVAAPVLVHVVGRQQNRENARICGTYQLMGVHDGKPCYQLPGTGNVLRYSKLNDWWLIDMQGFTQPGLKDRLFQWVINGDAGMATQRCNAFAYAGGAEHPAFPALQWHVYETQRGGHVHDPMVGVTTAPMVVAVAGRRMGEENADVFGEYQLTSMHMGRVAYHMARNSAMLSYYPPNDAWVLCRDGNPGDVCVAWAEGKPNADHPTGLAPWHVYSATRGRHLADPAVTVSASGCVVTTGAALAAPQQALAAGTPRTPAAGKENAPSMTQRLAAGLFGGDPAAAPYAGQAASGCQRKLGFFGI